MKPLRELTQQDVEWCWEDAQITAHSQLKEAVTCTPVLRYYNLGDEVMLQCDASKSGLGAALLQKGQPVAYASRALTPAETRYAQIEKELLAIVFTCEIFDTYTYGRDVVTVETDHKPLEVIVCEVLNSAPQCLQRMLLPSALVHELEEIDHKASLPVSDARWHQIENASADDPVFQELRMVIQRS